jgi:microcompartment protein CcmL/EutN
VTPLFRQVAIGLLEVESIARGIVVTDAVAKKAEVHVLLCEPVTPGKMLVLFEGGVGEVDEAFKAGIEAAGDRLVDKLFLAQAHRQLSPGIAGKLVRPALQSLGIVETNTVASCLLSADAALKGADVALAHLELAKGIGGKGYFTVAGPQHQVEAALHAAAAAIEPSQLVATELIARPHAELKGRRL